MRSVSFAQCRAAGLPDARFSVQLSGLMGGLPTPGAYLSASAPPGGVGWFTVLPGRDAGALEPALRARVGALVEVRDAGPLFIAGAPRRGLIALGGEGHARALAFAALVVDAAHCPDGLMLLGAWSASASTSPTLAAVLEVPALRAALSGFTLGDAARPDDGSAPTAFPTAFDPQPLGTPADFPTLRPLDASQPFGTPANLPTARPLGAPETTAWLELDGPGGRHRYPVGPAQVALGRAGDVPIADPHVSRRHAILERRLDGYVLQVLPTAHGVAVAGALHAQGTFPLADGDTFVMGDTRARLSITPGAAPRSPFQRAPSLEAVFSRLGLPPPPIPATLSLASTERSITSADPRGPRLSVTWGDGLADFSYRWASRAWTIALGGACFGTATLDPRRVTDTFLALGAVLADAMSREDTLSHRVDVEATSAAHALWRTPLGVEFVAADAHAALLEALTWRRTTGA